MSFPDQSVLDEIRRLREEIDLKNFESLSTGIGLGKLKPSHHRSLEPNINFSMSNENRNILASLPKTPAVVPMDSSIYKDPSSRSHLHDQWPDQTSPMSGVSQGPACKIPLLIRLMRFLVVHSIDMLMIIVLLVGGLLTGQWLLGQPINFDEGWEHFYPFQVSLELGAYKTASLVYATFYAYWLLLKVLVGLTIGEALVGPASKGVVKTGGALTPASREIGR